MKLDFKSALGGVVLLILLTGCCYLWYQWETAPYREEYAKTQQLAQEWASPLNTMETVQVLDDVEIQAVVKSPDQTDTGVENKNLRNPNVVEPDPIVTVKEVRVSPFGFGAYPKIPDGWYQGFFDRQLSREHELLARVRIKLHEQGVPTLGVGIDKTGMVYPFDKDQVYITFDETDLPALGHVRYIADIYGDATVLQQIERNAKARNSGVPIPAQIQIEADIPAYVQVLDKSEGFDPYTFLNLNRK